MAICSKPSSSDNGLMLRRCFSLSNRLPFDDDAFDLVHVVDIARGVPEHKVCAACAITVLRLLTILLVVFTIPGMGNISSVSPQHTV